ncbi:hypothetical protein EVAR_52342_1 [Eumeta japonica]|uniref:Uncharacterized protein n=1 Tax=Eumeta variegata TaxID=151549 RepID=A0A4C1Y4N2_EUMVA|nr:hypothetical protein EVAR_52342_1 [Eumeta japonica]
MCISRGSTWHTRQWELDKCASILTARSFLTIKIPALDSLSICKILGAPLYCSCTSTTPSPERLAISGSYRGTTQVHLPDSKVFGPTHIG